MHVNSNSELLWKQLTREIYVLLRHYGSSDELRKAFSNLYHPEGPPSSFARERCKYYSDLDSSKQSYNDWYCLMKYCQGSFINILDSGYFLDNGNEAGLIFMLDLDKEIIYFYYQSETYSEIIDETSLDELMTWADMPQCSLEKLVLQFKESRFVTAVKLQYDLAEAIQESSKIDGCRHMVEIFNMFMRDVIIIKNSIAVEMHPLIQRLKILEILADE